MSALLSAGLTVADTKIFLGPDRTLILQLASQGSPKARRRAAARVIAALKTERLAVTDERSHSVEDMEAYLAEGNTAEVFELANEQVITRRA